MINTIFTDFDGTLHDSDSKFESKLDGFLGFDGKTVWHTFFFKVHREIIHKKFPEKHNDSAFHSELLFELLGKQYDREEAKHFIQVCEQAEEECWTNPSYFDETHEFLQRMKDNDFKICLTTGSHAEEKARGIERFFSKKFFDFAFDETIIGYRKTEKNYYNKALITSNSKAQQTVSIGDTLSHDIYPAKSIGIMTIWINRRNEKKSKDKNMLDYEISNLLDALDKLNLKQHLF
ncbi:HAD family hydrolase [[Eubacterium] cellulosolvens]